MSIGLVVEKRRTFKIGVINIFAYDLEFFSRHRKLKFRHFFMHNQTILSLIKTDFILISELLQIKFKSYEKRLQTEDLEFNTFIKYFLRLLKTEFFCKTTVQKRF
jgi:hypothetical protein